MEQLDRQQELKYAMNGRMTLMMGGILLVANAITSTLAYGINIFNIAQEADKGTQECIEILQTVQMSTMMARITAVLFILVAVAEIFAGVCSLRLCNRVDRAALTKKIITGLLAVEITMQIFLLLTRMLNLGMLFTAIAVPLFMLWGATRLLKLAKADPKRVFAIDTKKAKEQQKAAKAAPKTPAKSLRERAMMQASDEEEGTEPEREEIPTEEGLEETAKAERKDDGREEAAEAEREADAAEENTELS